MTLNYSGAQSGAILGGWLDLDEVAQVFVCFDVEALLTPCPSSTVLITDITPLCWGHQMSAFLLTAICHHGCVTQRFQ